jgi:putative hydrolase of the HAD superfamily
MRAILFDFGGTLDYPRHWLDRFLAHYRAAGIDLTRGELDRAFNVATRTAYGAGPAMRNLSLAQLVDYLVRLQLEDLWHDGPSRPSGAFEATVSGTGIDAIVHRITGPFMYESISGLARSREILSALAPRFKIGVVSNFYGNLDRVIADAGMTEVVGAVADSGRLGISKPDAGIFAAALARLGVCAEDAAMVGDSLDKDCGPARRIGMKTVWLRHRDAHENREQSEHLADFTIDSLEELEHLEWQLD